MRDRKLTPEEESQYAELLGARAPFWVLDDDARALLVASMRLGSYERGAALLRQGERGDCLMVLVEGEAEVRVVLPGGEATRVDTARPGDVVGEMALLTGEPRNADVVAAAPTRVLILPARAFERIASKHLEVTVFLTRLIEDRLTKKCLEGHRIERCLGKGAMGVVYEAVHEASGARRALKMMSHRLAYDPDALLRFQREAESAQSLDSDHVVRVFGRFASHKTYFLVMELCDGPSLEDVVLRAAPLDEDVVRALLGQLASGLGHIHDRGYLHRDVKPANALVTSAGVVKLADLGLVRPLGGSHLTSIGQIVGTPSYMAPEQLAGSAIGTEADVYALGCIVYELITGERLFRENDLTALGAVKRSFVVPAAAAIRPGLSRDLYAFLRASLQVNPEKRRVHLEEIARWSRPLAPALVARWSAAKQSAAVETATTDAFSMLWRSLDRQREQRDHRGGREGP